MEQERRDGPLSSFECGRYVSRRYISRSSCPAKVHTVAVACRSTDKPNQGAGCEQDPSEFDHKPAGWQTGHWGDSSQPRAVPVFSLQRKPLRLGPESESGQRCWEQNHGGTGTHLSSHIRRHSVCGQVNVTSLRSGVSHSRFRRWGEQDGRAAAQGHPGRGLLWSF